MLKHIIGGFCLGGWLLVTAPGCDVKEPEGPVDPTSDFQSQTNYDEAYDQHPEGVAPD